MSTSNNIKLYTCKPVHWMHLPKAFRLILGWITIMIFVFSFMSAAFCILLLFPWTWRTFPVTSTIYFASVCISMIIPLREWPFGRKIGQLWYEIFQFSTNCSPERCKEMIERGDTEQFIMAMHPHGIVPLQAVLW